MNLANPTALLWASLMAPIVIFYILKIRLRRVPVSTILFWRQIFEEKQPRSIWQHLKHLLSLLLQLAFVALLMFALAEPFFHWEILEARRIVLVVDNSASMNATDLPPSRLAAAKERGQQVIAGLRFRDEMAIVAAGTQPQVVCGLTGHQRTLETALNEITPTDGPTRVAEAVELARRLLADQENGKVVILTDGAFDGADKLAEAGDVQFIAVGQKTGNVGITLFQVRRSLLDPIGYEILAEVNNYADQPVECKFNVYLNDEIVDVVPLKLTANGQWSQVFEKTSTQGGRLRAELDRTDALLADNAALALLPKREPQPVTLVTEGNLFLEMVYRANPLVKLGVLKDASKAYGLQPVGFPTIHVFHRKVPDKLPPGPIYVIDPQNSCDLFQVGDKLPNAIVTKYDKDSPLITHVRLDNVTMPEARQLTFVTKPQVLVSVVTGEPLYATVERPEGKVLVLTVNLDQGDLPLRTAFPIMVTNALAWFTSNRGDLREALATGAVTEAELPPGSGLLLWSPTGQSRQLPPGVTRTTIGPLDQCGIWSIAPELADGKPGTAVQEFACNLANRRESDLRPPDLLLAEQEKDSAAVGLTNRPIWFYLVALAWLLVGVEWYLYQRRWIS